jgi:hypothetical protein
MTEPEPYVPTSEELEAGRIQRRRPQGGKAAPDVVASGDDVHSFELSVEPAVDRRSRRRR